MRILWFWFYSIHECTSLETLAFWYDFTFPNIKSKIESCWRLAGWIDWPCICHLSAWEWFMCIHESSGDSLLLMFVNDLSWIRTVSTGAAMERETHSAQGAIDGLGSPSVSFCSGQSSPSHNLLLLLRIQSGDESFFWNASASSFC